MKVRSLAKNQYVITDGVDNKQARKYVDNGTFKIVESLLQKAV